MSDPEKKLKCEICKQRKRESREGWCLPCLRDKLKEKFGPLPSPVRRFRSADQKQARENELNPWQENAVRAMEDK